MSAIGCAAGKRLFTLNGWIMRTYCGSWNCPTCRRRLAQYWARNVYYGACLWRPNPLYFLTFTMPGWMTDPAQGYRELPKCWNTFRQIGIRGYECFSYAAFAEEQDLNRGMVHLHVITTANLPTRLNEIALHCGFGPQANNQLMTGHGAAYYVTKYASKTLPHAPRNFRRVRISQVWPRLPEPVLPVDYIPQETHESLTAYMHRVSAWLSIDLQTIKDRFDNHALDLQ